MKHRDGILDLVRGVSAVLVMLGHLRAFLFVDYAEAGNINPLWKGFYLLTGLGHQAVMVFFVLSGYFVGGSVLAALEKNNFSWTQYLMARLSRLWTVLAPALLLTLALDSMGGHYHPEAYAGSYLEKFMSGPSETQPAGLGWKVFLGNLFFLQTIETPVYGTNGPLWSLTYEFWYYLLFPLVTIGITGVFRANKTQPKKIWHSILICWVLFALILYWLPARISQHGLIWLMGTIVWWVSKQQKFAQLKGKLILGAVGMILFLVSLLASKSGHWLGSDWIVGLTFSTWMLTLLGPWKRLSFLTNVSTALSEISYTLYVIHFPILFLMIAMIFSGDQLKPGSHATLIFAGFAVGITAVSGVWWWLFERNTNQVRNLTMKFLLSKNPKLD